MDGETVALVVNWSTPKDLVRCILSAEQCEPGLDWYIWQNHHPEIDSQPALKGLKDVLGDRMRLLQSGVNRGHGYGINRLADRAWGFGRPEYYFVVNPDVIWTEPVINRLVTFLEEDPVRAIVGPKQMDSHDRITAGGIVGTLERPTHRSWHKSDHHNVMVRDSIKSTVVAGSAFLIRSQDFKDYGGLLEARHYYSETWLNYHLQAHGREVWYYGQPVMIHEWHKSSPVGHPVTDGKFQEDRELFRRNCDEHVPPIPHD